MTNSKPVRRGFTLRTSILTAFVCLLAATVLAIVGYNYYSNKKVILSLSNDLIQQASQATIEKTLRYLLPAETIMEISTGISAQGTLSVEDKKELETYTSKLLQFYDRPSIFYGDERGNFLGSRKLADGRVRITVIDRTVQPPVRIMRDRSPDGTESDVPNIAGDILDPRVRPWYTGAKDGKGIFWTDMYNFYASKAPGVTVSYPVRDKHGKFIGVFGMDIELDEICNFLQRQKVGKTGLTFIVNEKDEIIAFPDVSRLVKEDGTGSRSTHIHIDELGEDWVSTAFLEYQATNNPRFTFDHSGHRYIASFTAFPETFAKRWKIVQVVPEDDFVGAIKSAHETMLLISLAILLLGVLLAGILAKSISRPIASLTAETKRIKDLQLGSNFDISSRILEIQSMVEAISAMKNGLRAFERYVPSALVRQLIRTGEETRIGGKKKELTIFFSDIEGSARIAEEMTPESLMLHLSEYLEELTGMIIDQRGTIDKYIGDAVMAFWGAPIDEKDHAFLACRAALLCQKRLVALNARWEQSGKPCLPTRIGIHTGEAVVGNIGSMERMNYSVMGDAVNLASRLESANKAYGTRIIVSQATYQQVADRFIFRPLDIIAVQGKKNAVKIYELAAELDDASGDRLMALSREFASGFAAYQAKDWDKGAEIFGQLADRFPGDKPAKIYFSRCDRFSKEPPATDWDGVFRLESK